MILPNIEIAELAKKYNTRSVSTPKNITIEHFLTNEEEEETVAEFTKDVNTYMLYRYAVNSNHPNKVFTNMKNFSHLYSQLIRRNPR